MKIGIVGNGFVGQATKLLTNTPKSEVLVYDIDPKKCEPVGMQLSQLNGCELIFICVPTPMNTDGSCYLEIVRKALASVHSVVDETQTSIVLRSTVPPETSRELGVYFMPEFLTEKNWKHDVASCNHWIFGLLKKSVEHDAKFRKRIENIINLSYGYGNILHNDTRFVTTTEAEMAKYIRNVALAAKVGLCNEFEEFCRLKDINYDNVRQVAFLDSRIGSSHTQVPGHDGKRGFGGTCFPKDINSLKYEMQEAGGHGMILDAVIKRNEEVDRVNDKLEKGRAVV